MTSHWVLRRMKIAKTRLRHLSNANLQLLRNLPLRWLPIQGPLATSSQSEPNTGQVSSYQMTKTRCNWRPWIHNWPKSRPTPPIGSNCPPNPQIRSDPLTTISLLHKLPPLKMVVERRVQECHQRCDLRNSPRLILSNQLEVLDLISN